MSGDRPTNQKIGYEGDVTVTVLYRLRLDNFIGSSIIGKGNDMSSLKSVLNGAALAPFMGDKSKWLWSICMLLFVHRTQYPFYIS